MKSKFCAAYHLCRLCLRNSDGSLFFSLKKEFIWNQSKVSGLRNSSKLDASYRASMLCAQCFMEQKFFWKFKIHFTHYSLKFGTRAFCLTSSSDLYTKRASVYPRGNLNDGFYILMKLMKFNWAISNADKSKLRKDEYFKVVRNYWTHPPWI